METEEETLSDPMLFWAKSVRGTQDLATFHPLICHMIDVAMVARAMWDTVLSPLTRSRIAGALEIDEDVARAWVCFWAGLHDMGKASPAFQLMIEAARPRLEGAALFCPARRPDGPHGTVTTRTLPDILESLFGLSRPVAMRVASSIGGHHGVIPASTTVNNLTSEAVGQGRWGEERVALVQALASLLDVPRDTPPQRLNNATAMWLAGFVSVADWIGSDDSYFRFTVPDKIGLLENLAHYAAEATTTAQRALRDLRWTGWTPSTQTLPFAALFPSITTPVPMQEAIVALAEQLQEPGIVIIEAPMGEGKTEAAMYLADHWSVALGQRGSYFALPTQATSNQMFGRVKAFLKHRYPEDVVNLQLLHGHASLSDELQVLHRDHDRAFAPRNISNENAHDAELPAVVAAEWFTHRKRGLLAPFGVGTIDQALLAALATHHVFVRHFGLAHKTVIIDEVHAYDTYMSTLLERLLAWLGALGASVVLLSATLPNKRRKELAQAYLTGMGRSNAEIPDAPYPRITWATATTAGAEHVAASPERAKDVRLAWIDGRLPLADDEPFELGQRLLDSLKNGGCAAVICNTVGRAQQVYQALKPYFPGLADDGLPELDLLHARYLFKDRDEREKRVLARFGKDGRRPGRAVLVATQIIEQSLDLDFDLMVSDMAPIDLILQRLGRLHRHKRPRPDGLADPMVWLCRPEIAENGVPNFGRGTEHVYAKHMLLRSWLELRNRDSIDLPGDVESLIEAVYADQPCPNTLSDALAQCWHETAEALERDLNEDARQAEDRYIEGPDFDSALWRITGKPREEDAPELHPALQALTRLGDPTVSVICLYGTPGRPRLDRDGSEAVDIERQPSMEMTKELLRRSVTLTDKRVVFTLLKEAVPRGWQKSALLRNHRPIILDDSGSAAIGKYTVRLDRELGLIIVDVSKEV